MSSTVLSHRVFTRLLSTASHPRVLLRQLRTRKQETFSLRNAREVAGPSPRAADVTRVSSRV